MLSTTDGPNWARPSHTSDRGTTRLGSSRSWASSSTRQAPGWSRAPLPSGSWTRRQSLTRPPTTAPERTQAWISAARARTLA